MVRGRLPSEKQVTLVCIDVCLLIGIRNAKLVAHVSVYEGEQWTDISMQPTQRAQSAPPPQKQSCVLQALHFLPVSYLLPVGM